MDNVIDLTKKTVDTGPAKPKMRNISFVMDNETIEATGHLVFNPMGFAGAVDDDDSPLVMIKIDNINVIKFD